MSICGEITLIQSSLNQSYNVRFTDPSSFQLTYCEQVYMHQTGSAYFAYIHIFFTIFSILMLPIRKLKTSHFITWLAQRARNKSANTSARIGFLNAGQDHIGLDFSFRSHKKNFFLSYDKSFFGQAYSITMARHWPRSKHTKKLG